MINATKKWIFLKISGAILVPLMLWFIINLSSIYDQEYLNVIQDLFNISKLLNKKFSSLSQGQMQIVSIIRGIASNPKIILLDEVFSSIDTKHKEIVYTYLTRFISKTNTLAIFTSHNKNHQNLVFKELCLK